MRVKLWSSRSRWSKVAAGWEQATPVSMTRAHGHVPWQSLGACTTRKDLPWTADPEDINLWEFEVMRSLCGNCPVREQCADFADQSDVCAGWWAGTNRDPAYIGPAVPAWVPGGDAA